MKRLMFAAVTVGLALTAGATESQSQVAHRRAARGRIASGGVKAAERLVADADPGVRRYALFCVFEKDQARGKELARRLADDADDSVKALAKELLRERKGTRRAPTPLPLSQNPLNDHELLPVKSITCLGGVPFKMPDKFDCDEIEVWLGAQKEPLNVWIGDYLVASYDPAIDGTREFRFDATKFLKWGAQTEILITDARGRDHEYKFSVEFFKCGK